MLALPTFCAASPLAQSPNLIGRWNVEITFANAGRHSLRFDAQGAGTGSFLLLDPRSSLLKDATPSKAKWAQDEGNYVTFLGAVEFPIGNVGRDVGTLVFKGKFETEGLIRGEVAFFPLDQDRSNPEARPSKSGTFKATRAAGG
jgi:hypothetical protein